MNAKKEYKKLHRELRITSRGLDLFEKHMNLIKQYRLKYNTWEMPLNRWSIRYFDGEYKPYRKFSVILKQWAILDKFEY